jgi:ribose/xylose/arabinose/galactoside ABC-type transport system permease subunit
LLLVAGCVLAAFGVVLLLDRTETIDLSFGSMAPMAFAVVGAVLLATGLTRRE